VSVLRVGAEPTGDAIYHVSKTQSSTNPKPRFSMPTPGAGDFETLLSPACTSLVAALISLVENMDIAILGCRKRERHPRRDPRDPTR
jgi:hypothetical protein